MRRPKPAKLAVCPRLREVVEGKLKLRWSPQQIAAWLVGQAQATQTQDGTAPRHQTLTLGVPDDAGRRPSRSACPELSFASLQFGW